MKKFGLGLLAVVVLACAITVARTGQARAATIPLGCPGSTIQGPPSPTSNYSCSGGNPEGLKAAKSRLTNAVVGLILLSLMFVILHVIGIV